MSFVLSKMENKNFKFSISILSSVCFTIEIVKKCKDMKRLREIISLSESGE